MPTSSAEPIFAYVAEHGEGPLWDAATQRYYWVDLLQGRYLCGDPATGEVEPHDLGQALGVMALRAQGGVVTAVRDGFGFYHPARRAFRLIEPSPEQHNPAVRFNDGAVGPGGRFYAGTMTWDGQVPVGKLFRLGRDHAWAELDSGFKVPNGMGWSPDGQTFYMIDTFLGVMFAYDYDLATGDLSGRRVHLRFPAGELADGMCLDTEGCFWIAFYGGGKVVQYDPSGEVMTTVPVPVDYPTSCCFGPDGQLFITTSRVDLPPNSWVTQPLAGRCFVVQTEAQGLPVPRYAG